MQPLDSNIGIADRRFTLGDAAFVSGVSAKTIHNWHQRGVLAVGDLHFTGRRVFSLLDIVVLAAMHDLAVRLQMPLAQAALAAEMAAQLAAGAVATDELPHLFETDDARPCVNLLVAIGDDGDLILAPADIRHPGAYLPPTGAGSPLRRAHVVLPAYAILADCIGRTAELIRRRTDSNARRRGA